MPRGSLARFPGFFVLLSFFPFYFKEAKPLAKLLFFSTASSTRNGNPSLERTLERGSRVEFNLSFFLSFFRGNNRFEIISISRQISFSIYTTWRGVHPPFERGKIEWHGILHFISRVDSFFSLDAPRNLPFRKGSKVFPISRTATLRQKREERALLSLALPPPLLLNWVWTLRRLLLLRSSAASDSTTLIFPCARVCVCVCAPAHYRPANKSSTCIQVMGWWCKLCTSFLLENLLFFSSRKSRASILWKRGNL